MKYPTIYDRKKHNAPHDHGFGIADLPTVRADIIHWLNGHL